MPALMYGELLVARLVELLAGKKHMAFATRVLLGVVSVVFLFFVPVRVLGCGSQALCPPPLHRSPRHSPPSHPLQWTYSLPLTNAGHDRRRWLPRWN